ncbi:MAG: bifunctional DNA primase/polymerase [Anaerolineae bacterium]|nr:bifunctional DNA primase/polymerase [Anaerolineae bacterium]
MSKRNRLLAAAVAYARWGWAVHPLRPGDKRPLVKDWPHQATTDLRTIQAWWAQWPDANVGLACEPSGLFVVDLDVKGNADGLESWAKLRAQLGLGDLVTPTSRTPSGGRHLFFAAGNPALGNSTGRLGTGIDTRGAGGYVLLPPSTLADGTTYTWEISPREHDPVPLPPALVDLLANPEPCRQGDNGGSPRNATERGAAYALAAMSGELAKLATATSGTRNNTLNTAAYALGQLVGAGLLNRAEVEGRLLAVALSTGLEEREALATLASGLDAGQKQPRVVPDNGRKLKAIQPPTPEVATVSYAEHEFPPLPDYARLPPDLGRDACPWLDNYIGFSRTWSPRSFDGFHEACALWLLSTVAARRVVVHYGRPRYTNLYFLLAGRTTMHAKSSATDIARGLLRACGLDYLLAADEATPQAFVRALAGGGLPINFDSMEEDQRLAAKMRMGFCGQRGWYAEEFGSWLASMTRTDGVMADFRGLLRKLDDCPPDYSRSTIARGDEVIHRPYLALIANLTPADLRPVAKKGTQLWGDGFLARFAFITPPRGEVLTAQFPKGQRPCPPDLTAPLVAWHRQLGLPKVQIENQVDRNGDPTGEKIVAIEPSEPQVCTLADDVWDALHRYNMGVLEIAQGSELTDLDGNYGRLHEKALRIAALLASMENGDRVELRHWARAQEVAERWRLYAHRLYEQVTEMEVSQQAEMEDKVVDTVRRWQGTERYPDGLTANDIGRFVWGLGAVEVKHYADQLVAAHVLEKHKPGRAERYFVPQPEPDGRGVEE